MLWAVADCLPSLLMSALTMVAAPTPLLWIPTLVHPLWTEGEPNILSNCIHSKIQSLNKGHSTTWVSVIGELTAVQCSPSWMCIQYTNLHVEQRMLAVSPPLGCLLCTTFWVVTDQAKNASLKSELVQDSCEHVAFTLLMSVSYFLLTTLYPQYLRSWFR